MHSRAGHINATFLPLGFVATDLCYIQVREVTHLTRVMVTGRSSVEILSSNEGGVLTNEV